MTDKKRMTAPETSVDADEGQSLKGTECSISDGDKDYKEKIRRLQEKYGVCRNCSVCRTPLISAPSP